MKRLLTFTRQNYSLLLIALLAISANAQTTRDGFVLVPLYTSEVPGALGSVWTTHLTVRNDGTTAVLMTPLICPFVCAGPITVQPGRDVDVSAAHPSSFGEIVRMPSSQADQLRFHATFQDLSRQASSAGVELSVVRQNEMRTRVVLLNVPLDTRFRSALRIYDVSAQLPSVHLRIFALDQNDALVDDVISLAPPPPAGDNEFPAERDIFDLSETYPSLSGTTAIRIEVEGNTPTLWAFVSTTNNVTQEVTLVTPQ